MFGPKLPYVMSDCDGTIVNHDLTIAKETIAAILKYQKQSGYRFAFCTGRLDVANRQLARQLKVQLPIVACNGALITDLKTNEVLYADYLDSQICATIFRECHKLKIDMIAYVPGAMVGTKTSHRLQVWQRYQEQITNQADKWPIHFYDDLEKLASAIEQKQVCPVELTMYCEDQNKLKQALAMLAAYDQSIDVVQSLPTMFNVMNKGTNKLTGLIRWAEIVQTNYQEVIVFGDNHNDLAMVEGVFKGIAVGNAVDELKTKAYKVCETIDNNGVGKELERLVATNG
ncbi:Cof-type HAD-IIB family hydrolase [Mesoplasma seiffertii]|uniref:Cof-type HAD-IIB family hydrolase n=1 Tax=Mesoplasma seiffertii TaxID=28224 RepID=UPI00055B7C83|nr:Cof-type HAD-IIB family hydrolase [Mesoplasma seiffertii]